MQATTLRIEHPSCLQHYADAQCTLMAMRYVFQLCCRTDMISEMVLTDRFNQLSCEQGNIFNSWPPRLEWKTLD